MTNNFTPKKSGAAARPQLSPEEYAAKKKAEKDAVYQMIDDTATEIVSDPDKFRAYLDTQARMDRYSAANALLIYKQQPQATQLKDFRDWQEDGVKVNKGAKSLSILEPVEYTKNDGSTGIAYNVKKVFDVAQTSGKKPAAPTLDRDPRKLVAIMLDTAPIDVSTVEELPSPNMGAFYKNEDQTLYIKRDIGDSVALCQCVAQELGHAQLAMNCEAYSRRDMGFSAVCVGYKLSHGFEREKKEALTVAQQKLFFDYMLSHPKDTHWYPVFYVMANTGMRVGEITGLRWSDIDLKKGIIRVNHTLVYYNHRDEKGCYFSINTPKTKAGEREIPMTEGVKQAFLMEREFQSQAEISSKSRVDGYDDFIFVNRYGDVQNQGNLNKALRRMMRDCNDEILEKYGADSDPVLLPQFSCHILRHTFATRLCESGANLKFIQSILGHADVSTTMNIYVDVTDALKKKEITAFDDYMTTKLET